ncbi:GntR family transcriptional regulator [Ramlibacter sp.]|uniref:GntR family transcriptional regulator n=1 Tax=Ramlibacter sp. TaxID=1917967 RepID=UPI003D1076F7
MNESGVVELSDSRRLKNELAYETLLLEIICGGLRAGDAIDEISLAETYGMPRAGVREALSRLALEGLVDRRPRLGTVVTDIGAIELQQVFALRVQLEGSAAALAATHATRKDVAALNAAFNGVDDVIARADYRTLIMMDLNFHQALGEATHNRWLAKVTNTLLLGALRFWHYSLTRRAPETLRAEIDAHLRVAKAVSMGDPEAAQAAMREILAEFPSTVKESFDESLYRAPAGMHRGAP